VGCHCQLVIDSGDPGRHHVGHAIGVDPVASFQPFAAGKPSGKYEIFADGFAVTDPATNKLQVQARPDGVAEAPDGSLYIGESNKGKIWRVIYKGK